VSDRPVHPAAAVWPMLADEELQALADDIAANGLIHPIVLTPDGEVLDGRNRLAACLLAQIEPEFVEHSGDPVAYVLSANARRRDMSKGAKAMAAFSVSENTKLVDISIQSSASLGHVGQAAMVAKWAPDLVDVVIAGTKTLDKAYADAKRRKDDHDSHDARLARLPDDLAALVVDSRMSLTEAESAQRQRETDIANQRKSSRMLLDKVRGLLDPEHDDPSQWAREWVGRLDVTTDDVDSMKRVGALMTALLREMRKAAR
jgi:ParB-like nuclease domain